jgi:RHS repeat-associated protein
LVVLVAFVAWAAVVSGVGGAAQEAPSTIEASASDTIEEADEGEFDWSLPGPGTLPLDRSEQRAPDDAALAEWSNPEKDRPGLTPGRATVVAPVDGGRASPVGLPVTLVLPPQVSDRAEAVVEVLPVAEGRASSPFGVAFTLEFGDVKPTLGASVPVEFDYTDVAVMPGGRAIERLELTLRTGCSRDKGELECRESVDLDTTNDIENRVLKAEISTELLSELLASPESGAALSGAGPVGSGVVLMSMTSSAGDGASDYSAVPLSPLGEYQVGTFTGDVSLSYPIPIPQLEQGVAPSVVLGYSSGAVDFMVPTENNQAASWVGVGWSYAPGSITRNMGDCEGSYADHEPCIVGEHYSLSLNGVSSPLVQDPTDDDRFYLVDDPYWRIERMWSANSSHPDGLGEYWLVRTPDGVTWRFGGEFVGTGNEDVNSAWFTPVYNAGSIADQQCTTGVVNGYCDRVYQWNLDLVEDPSGNQTVYKYETEINYYDADDSYRRDYVRAGHVSQIRYGASASNSHYAVRVDFNTEPRCVGTNCESSYEDYPDTPWDLECGSSGSCDQDAATYWTSQRLDEIVVSNKNDTSSSWSTVSRWSFEQDYPTSPDVGRTPMRLRWIQQRKADDSSGTTKTIFDTIWLANRLNTPTGGDVLSLPRIDEVTTTLGGTVEYTYGRPESCPTGTVIDFNDWHKHCFPISVDGWAVIYNKWVVTEMTRTGKYSGSEVGTYTYSYDTPSWAKDLDPVASIHWHNDFRGHKIVWVDDGAGVTEHRFFQGMHNDDGASGPKSASVQTADSNTYTDWAYKKGKEFEQRRLTAKTGGSELSRTETEFGWVEYTSAITDTDGLSAPRFVAPTKVEEWVGSSKSETRFEDYDDYGNLTESVFWGLSGVSADNSNTVSSFHHVDTSSTYLVDRPYWTKLRTGLTVGSGTLMSDVRYAYDDNSYGTAPTDGLLTKQKALVEAGGAWAETEMEYDSRGRVTKTWDPENNLTQRVYDDAGRLETVRHYIDDTDYLRTVTTHDTAGRPWQLRSKSGKFTYLEYDSYGRLSDVWLPTETYNGGSGTATMRFTYEPGATVPYVKTRQLLSGSNYVESYQYVDGFGREIQTQTPFVTPDNTLQRTVVSKKYNAQGLLKNESALYELTGLAGSAHAAPDWSDMLAWRQFFYDDAGRLEETKQRSDNWETLWAHDVVYTDRTVSERGPEGERTDRTYDGTGNLTKVVEYRNGSPYATTDLTYDIAGNLKAVDGAESGTDDEISFSYDLLGRKKTMADPDMGNWAYTYDLAGRLTHQNDGKNQDLYFDYDGLDNLIEQRTSPTSGSGVIAEWSYSSSTGRLVWSKSHTAEGTVQVTNNVYDALDRVTKRTTTIPDDTMSRYFAETWAYNAAGDLATYRYPANASAGLGETVTYSYDSDTGRVVSLAGSGTYVDEIDYDAAGNIVKMHLGANGADANRTFDIDAVTRRLEMARAGKGTNLWNLVKLEYTYDDSSNVTSITDFRNKTSGVAQQQCYEYDDLGRMTSGHTQANGSCSSYAATGTAPFDVTMTYSPSGNIESMIDPVRGIDWDYDYTADPHQVTQVDDGVGGVDASFVYDGNGSMKTRTVGSTSQTLQYDENGRLDKVKVGGSAQAEFLYDADGNRVRAIQGGVSTFYVGDYEWVSSSDWKRNYRVAGMLVAVDDGGDLWWTMDDHLGSTGAQYKVSGNQVLRQRYDPWGLIRDTDGLVTDIGYTSQRLDQATGLMYYQARYYDPMIGRFTSADTIIPDIEVGQDWNRYTYVRNNPLLYTDPTGHWCVLGKNPDGSCRGANKVRAAARVVVDSAVSVVKEVVEDPVGTALTVTMGSGAADVYDHVKPHVVISVEGCALFCGGVSVQDSHVFGELGGVGTKPGTGLGWSASIGWSTATVEQKHQEPRYGNSTVAGRAWFGPASFEVGPRANGQGAYYEPAVGLGAGYRAGAVFSWDLTKILSDWASSP